MAIGSACPELMREMAWIGERQRRIDVYTWDGGARLVAVLRLTDGGGVLLLNRRRLPPEGRRIAIGWAFATAEREPDGWYAYWACEAR